MKKAIVIGSGIAGMTCAIRLARSGVNVTVVSPFPSERSQSVMAAGGINGVLSDCEEGDSVQCHVDDTLKGGSYIAGKNAVTGLCKNAENIIEHLKEIGTVFSVDGDGQPMRRAFGGQSHRRTYYCGSATGKHIVSALVMELRRYEAAGLVERKLWSCFYSALIKDGVCYGVILFDETKGTLVQLTADAVVMAVGGQNAMFGKTTGSTQCDGYAAGKLFTQGVELKNLEFIQYHPTTVETPQKRMLISEAVRGEGGRLFYVEDEKRVYFMEQKYGAGGNLMTRDVISREIDSAGKEVFLDISFLGEKEIDKRLPEVRELCLKYIGLDIAKEPIPVAPSVHFFMGGIAVHMNHETNIKNLFAIGECASMYHGANRLGGNSLLSAQYSAIVAADEIAGREFSGIAPDFSSELDEGNERLKKLKSNTDSQFPSAYIREMLADTMRDDLGISRDAESLEKGIKSIDYYLSVADSINYDSSVAMHELYSLGAILHLARATLTCAKQRRESRGAHFRADYPQSDDGFAYATIISYDDGKYNVCLDKEQKYES
ncbi:MAG: FAD-binding protein [Ruminococcaceae bacterium]|nr:FAD-binding protein [Oscillospiraceae bacterium]